MGRLTSLSGIDLDASWYFPDASWSSDSQRYYYAWPNPAYPFKVAIHQDDLAVYNDRKISIRHWVEQNLQETVIVDILDKSYRKYLDEEQTWESSYEVRNKWNVFYFSNEHSAAMFALRFSEYIQPITDTRPGW